MTAPSPVLAQLQADLGLSKNEIGGGGSVVRWAPLEMSWENLFNYKTRMEFNFADKHVIYMPNAAGKSAILDIMLFALFDRSWRTSSRERLFMINADSNEGWCELKFEVKTAESAAVYTIRRQIDRAGVNTVKLTNEKGQMLNKLMAVNKKITELVGDMDTLVQTMVLPQNYHDGCSLLTMPTAARKKVMTTLFNVETREKVERWFKQQMGVAKQRLEEVMAAQARLVKPVVVSAAALSRMENQYLKNEGELANLASLRAKVIELPAGITHILDNYVKYKAELANLSRLNYAEMMRELKKMIAKADNRLGWVGRLVDHSAEVAAAVPRPVCDDVVDELEYILENGCDLGARVDVIRGMRRAVKMRELHAELRMISAGATGGDVGNPSHLPMYKKQLANVMVEYERFQYLTRWVAEHEKVIGCIKEGITTPEEQQFIKLEIARLEKIKVENDDLLVSIRRAMEADVIAKQIDIDAAKLKEMRVAIEARIDDLKVAQSKFVFKEIPAESKFGDWTLHGGDFELSCVGGGRPVKLLSGFEKLVGEVSLRRALAEQAVVPMCSRMILDEPFDSVSDENIPVVMRLLAADDIVFTSRR